MSFAIAIRLRGSCAASYNPDLQVDLVDESSFLWQLDRAEEAIASSGFLHLLLVGSESFEDEEAEAELRCALNIRWKK